MAEREWKIFTTLSRSLGGVTLVLGSYCPTEPETGTYEDNHIHFAHSDGIRPLLKWARARHPNHEFKSEKDGYGGWYVLERRRA